MRLRNLIIMFVIGVLGCLLWAQTPRQYRYWFDNSEAEVRTGAIGNDGNLNLEVDVSEISSGLHAFHFQVIEGDTISSSPYSALFVKAVPERSDFRYWFDTDESHAVQVKGTDLSTKIDVSQLLVGMHTLHIQALGDNPSSVYSSLFVKSPVVNGATNIQYWFDQDQGNAVEVKNTELVTDIKVSHLPDGLHALHVQASGAVPSSIYSALFIKTGNVNNGESVTLRSSIDGQTYKTETCTAVGDVINCNFNVEDLRMGLHSVTIEIITATGNLSSAIHGYFLRVPSDDEFKNMKCYYTFDEGEKDYMLADTYQNGLFQMKVDVSDPALEVGEHTISCMLVLDDGTVTDMHTATFTKGEIVDFRPSYPKIEDLKAASSLKEVTLTWSAPDLSAMEEELKNEYLPQDKWPKLVGYIVYRNGEKLSTDTIKSTSFADTSMDLTMDNKYQVTSVYSDKGESELSNEVMAQRKALKPLVRYHDRHVVIESDNADAKFYYSIDKKDPAVNGTLYEGPLSLTSSCTVMAIAKVEGWFDSDVTEYVYEIGNYACPTPTIGIEGAKVTISVPEGGYTVYYTLDGSTPSSQSTKYEGAITVDHNCTVNAIATAAGKFDSSVATAKVESFKAAKPAFALDGYMLSISSETDKAVIHYTTDGKAPASESPTYSEPVKLEKSCTIKAVAMRADWNDSEVAELAFDVKSATVAQPTITFTGNKVKIECATKDAQIRYTLSADSVPNASSRLYEGEFEIDVNCTVSAIALLANWFDSPVANKKYEGFHVLAPEISLDGYMMAISCPTDGAEIRYTIDGTKPTSGSPKYSAPVKLEKSCTVKAVALRTGYVDSEIAEKAFDASDVTCAMPEIRAEGNTATISCATANAIIHYTVDGTEPTAESPVYSQTVTVDRNCTIKAVAMRDKWFDSSVAAAVIDWLTASTPTFRLVQNGRLEIASATERAEIRYAIGGEEPNEQSQLYTEPLILTDNRVVKARAYAEGLNPSEVARYLPNSAQCQAPSISYDGRWASIITADGNEVHYTTDGTMPDSKSPVYGGRFDTEGIVTIAAVAMRDNFNDSEIVQYRTPAYFDGARAIIDTPDSLSVALGWIETDEIERIAVEGNVGDEDVKLLTSLPQLQVLDMEQAAMKSLPDGMLANTHLLWTVLPKTAETVGERLFAGCDRLSAVIWTSEAQLPESAMDSIGNPNLLLYTGNGYEGTNVTNVVENGHAQSLTLIDGRNFFAPYEFEASEAEYTHSYQKQTPLNGGSAGWETLTLPFDVQSIEHESKGELKPFAALDGDFGVAKPFWLYSLGENGWESEDEIHANEPYLIAMPNNQAYADDYIVAGDVTFSAKAVTVPATEPVVVAKGQYSMVPTTIVVERSQRVAPISEEGDRFEPNRRDARPFEAYLTADGAMRAPVGVAELGQPTNGVPNVMLRDEMWRVYSYDGVLYISTSIPQTVTVYNLAGIAQRIVELQFGVNAVEDLPTGVYFVKSSKVMVRP